MGCTLYIAVTWGLMISIAAFGWLRLAGWQGRRAATRDLRPDERLRARHETAARRRASMTWAALAGIVVFGAGAAFIDAKGVEVGLLPASGSCAAAT